MKTSKFKFVSAFSLAVLIFVAISCQNRDEKVELDKFNAMAKMHDQNKAIVREFFSAIDNQSFDKLNELMSDDFTLNAAGLTQPWKKDDVFQDIKRYYTSFPDWTHVIENMIAEGDKVVVKLTQHGTQKAQFEEIAPTNAKVTKSAIHIVTIVNGEIKEWWAIEDDLGLMLQLGMELRPTKSSK